MAERPFYLPGDRVGRSTEQRIFVLTLPLCLFQEERRDGVIL